MAQGNKKEFIEIQYFGMENKPKRVERLVVDFENDDKPEKKSKNFEQKKIGNINEENEDEMISNENDKMSLNKTMEFLSIDY